MAAKKTRTTTRTNDAGPKQVAKLVFRNVRSPEHRYIPVAGVWGGPAAGGLVNMHAYVEHQEIPETTDFEVKAGIAEGDTTHISFMHED